MGILNATPDSFYEKSRMGSVEAALEQAKKMISEGAEILDIGGYSSRPGAKEVSEEEEINRVIPVITAVKTNFKNTLISIDTFRSTVAEKAILAGADMVNDISGGQADPAIFEITAKYQCPYIMMHMRGTPQNMMQKTNYNDLIPDLIYYFSEQIEKAQKAGLKDIIIDPGFGFSKTVEQNFAVLNRMELFRVLEKSILIGVSRKSMIYKSLEITAEESLNGTTVLNTIALEKGAQILRVHDVKEASEAVKLHILTRSFE